MSWNGFENNVLLRNDGTDGDGVPRFTDVAMALGADDIGDSRGVAVADFDHDGDLDLAINHNPGDFGAEGVPVALLRNEVGSRRGWLAVDLVGTESNRDGVGALVTLEGPTGRQVRLASAGSAYASQSSPRLYFGLGEGEAAAGPFALEVLWPSGRVDRHGGIPGRRLVRLTEGGDAEVMELEPAVPRIEAEPPRLASDGSAVPAASGGSRVAAAGERPEGR